MKKLKKIFTTVTSKDIEKIKHRKKNMIKYDKMIKKIDAHITNIILT